MSGCDYTHLEVIEEGSVLWARMNRPEQYNALNRLLIDELRDFFTRLYWEHRYRIVVLTGAGRNFCAGLDIKEHAASSDPGTGGALLDQRKISEIVIAMRRCQQPIVGVVQGAASGGGFALALASDIRIGTPDTRMNAAFIRLGVSACDIGVSYFLPRMVGCSIASEFMLTGRFIDADRAQRLGLLNRVVAPDMLAAEARSFVGDMLHTTPLALRLTKEALNHSVDAGGLEAVIAMEDRNQVLCLQGEDFAEGIAAFREKRPPRYAESLPGDAPER